MTIWWLPSLIMSCQICGSADAKKLCGNLKCKSEFSRKTILKSFKKHGGEITKFRKTNGMFRPEVRAKVSTKLRAMGWKPTVQGGNGRGPTIHELAISAALGWPCNVIVRTGVHSYHPTHYKIDVGNQDLKIAIEVNGFSHTALCRKAQDKKKKLFLESMGWRVLSFTNAEIHKNLKGCVQEVLSIISTSQTETPILQKDR